MHYLTPGDIQAAVRNLEGAIMDAMAKLPEGARLDWETASGGDLTRLVVRNTSFADFLRAANTVYAEPHSLFGLENAVTTSNEWPTLLSVRPAIVVDWSKPIPGVKFLQDGFTEHPTTWEVVVINGPEYVIKANEPQGLSELLRIAEGTKVESSIQEVVREAKAELDRWKRAIWRLNNLLRNKVP